MKAIFIVLSLVLAAPSFAQTNAAADAPDGAPSNSPTTPAATGWTVKVKVSDGLSKKPVADSVVFLRAARPKGPFEPTDPAPAQEWTAITDASGVATFSGLPESLGASGLRLHAATTWNGLTFKSTASPPADKISLDVDVYEKGVDLKGVRFSSVRTVIEPWEDYLIFTQFYMLTNTSKTALDTALLPGVEFERGLPIRLPTKAQGIRVSGPGQSLVVDSLVYWQGTLKPGEQVPLQVSFSMAVHSAEYVYEQEMEYEVDNAEILVPLQTRYAKLPRLDKVSLAAPEFRPDAGYGLFGMRDDMEFIGATGKALKIGESLKFKVSGLPYAPPMTPFVVFGAALLSALGVAVVGRREARRVRSAAGLKDLRVALEAERTALLDDLVKLRNDLKAGAVTQDEHDALSISLSERLALVLKKLSSLDNAA